MTADMPKRMDSITSTVTATENHQQQEGAVEQQTGAENVVEQQEHSDEQKEEEHEQRLQEEEMTPRISNSQIVVGAQDIVTTLSAIEESMSQVNLSGTSEASPTDAATFDPPLAMDPTDAPTPREAVGSSKNSRESLRETLDRRRNTLTESELSFLEQLTVTGTSIEVELAMQTLQDDDLFFDYSTPRHLKYEGGFSFGGEDETAARQRDFRQDIGLAVSETEPDLTSVTERTDADNLDDVVVETRGSMGVVLPKDGAMEGDDDTRDGAASTVAGGRGDSTRSLKSSASSAKAVAGGNTNHKKGDPADPPVPASIPVMIGSKKRLEVLELRRNSVGINLGKIWKAHETGLAVTAAGSRLSIRRRQSMDGSVVSNLSGTSGYSRQAQMDIFRRQEQADVFRNRETPTKISVPKNKISPKPVAKQTPPRPRRGPYNRSNSVTFGMIASPGSSKLKGVKPKIPGPLPLYRRRSSTGSRKSVTFHHIDEEFEFDDSHHFEHDDDDDDMNEEKKMSASDLAKRSKGLRRSMSDSIRYDPQPLLEDEELKDKQVPTHTPSTSTLSSGSPLDRQDSVPSIHLAAPIRQDSMSSVPSLHHGHPLRQDSTSSVPSLHHGHPVRQESTQSIPSLHHAVPLRENSMSSIPSLHHGVLLCDNSVTSIPSLHHGVPLQDNSVTSIHSLHHAHPIHQDSMHSIPSLHHGHPLHSTDDFSEDMCRSRVRTFSASNDVASAWLQQQPRPGDTRTSSMASLGSLPHNVTVPLTETETAERETSVDDLSVLSPSHQDENDEPPPPPAPKPLGGTPPPKPILMRLASKNVYEGEGIEVTELEDDPLEGNAPRNISILSMDASIRTVNSYDDLSMYSFSHRRTSDIFRTIRRSYSDESLSGMYLGSGRDLLVKLPDFSGNDTIGTTYGEDHSEASWDMQSEISGRFDAWNVLSDDYVNGYGGGGTLGFSILGTSASDESAQPHVLSPPLMESLQAFMPYSKMGQNFFLKYSMVRDGASLPALLRRARGVQYTILAVETIDGEVFGSFTSQPWRKNWNYFGTGESFLWKMRRSRLEKTHGILDQAQKESEIEVYPYTGENRFIQLCTHDRIAVGGGFPSSDAEKKMSEDVSDHEWGFGLAIQSDMLQGSSSPCLTFGSPSLSNAHPDGSLFEVINIELWTLTPCATVEEAEKLELGKLFLQKDPSGDMQYAY